MAKTPEFPKPSVVPDRPAVHSVKLPDGEYAVMCGWLECRGRIAFGITTTCVSDTIIPVCERCDNKFTLNATPVRFEIIK